MSLLILHVLFYFNKPFNSNYWLLVTTLRNQFLQEILPLNLISLVYDNTLLVSYFTSLARNLKVFGCAPKRKHWFSYDDMFL